MRALTKTEIRHVAAAGARQVVVAKGGTSRRFVERPGGTLGVVIRRSRTRSSDGRVPRKRRRHAEPGTSRRTRVADRRETGRHRRRVRVASAAGARVEIRRRRYARWSTATDRAGRPRRRSARERARRTSAQKSAASRDDDGRPRRCRFESRVARRRRGVAFSWVVGVTRAGETVLANVRRRRLEKRSPPVDSPRSSPRAAGGRRGRRRRGGGEGKPAGR